ncbi:hypothetical protein [Guptibacillus hwajinpoensis]|uniref:Uncharacterized protein n=1 Tax=Guptibacillus hwajinpoensis TaxID=208199 RepID=A0ABU0K562_9BACL|nr:hypothetical protein [Alkalihalobacillus hemicentroti]MDQ0483820.1 hypothetical protein [Alkalihalobacillus hemicentroti]
MHNQKSKLIIMMSLLVSLTAVSVTMIYYITSGGGGFHSDVAISMGVGSVFVIFSLNLKRDRQNKS